MPNKGCRSGCDQTARIWALGFLAWWQLTSHALYYNLPYFLSYQRFWLEPPSCKKWQKKTLPQWSEWYQIDPKFGIIQNLQTSPIPQPVPWRGLFFATSYSKVALTQKMEMLSELDETWYWERGMKGLASRNGRVTGCPAGRRASATVAPWAKATKNVKKP